MIPILFIVCVNISPKCLYIDVNISIGYQLKNHHVTLFFRFFRNQFLYKHHIYGGYNHDQRTRKDLNRAKALYEAKRYHLIYNILRESDLDAALMHAKLYLALKLENSGEIESDIEDLCLDEDSLDILELEKETREYWLRI